MSEEIIAVVITGGIIALLFAWVPLLNLVCPPCAAYLQRRRLELDAIERQRIDKHAPGLVAARD